MNVIPDTLSNQIGAVILLALLFLGFLYVCYIVVEVVFDIFKGFKVIFKDHDEPTN